LKDYCFFLHNCPTVFCDFLQKKYCSTSILFFVSFRVKKWWSPFYTWSLSVSAVNSWRLRMLRTGKKEPFLIFLRELVIEMLSTHGHPPLKRGPAVQPLDCLRYDGLNHWIMEIEGGKRRNCKQCYASLKKELKVSFVCKKCTVPLHVTCFEERNYCLCERDKSLFSFRRTKLFKKIPNSPSCFFEKG